MLNRPRPRKIVAVVKSTSVTDGQLEDAKRVGSLDSQPTHSASNDSVAAAPLQSAPLPRKPIVATLRRAIVPPPPAFADTKKPAARSMKSDVSETEAHVSFCADPQALFSADSQALFSADSVTSLSASLQHQQPNCTTEPVRSATALSNCAEPVRSATALSNCAEPARSATALSNCTEPAHSATATPNDIVPIGLEEPPRALDQIPSEHSASDRSPLSPRSSGEVFLDAADRAANLFSGAIFDTFKKLNLRDISHEPVRLTSPTTEPEPEPFADIMAKLRPPSNDSDNPRLDSPRLDSPHNDSLHISDASLSPETELFEAPGRHEADSPMDNPADTNRLVHLASPVSTDSSRSAASSGFRSNILKHGLSALERIGKTTADVVVSTRNKLSEPGGEFAIPRRMPAPITPDFTDTAQSFYDIFQLYGGHTKLQEMQIRSVRAAIAIKTATKRASASAAKRSSFDFCARISLLPRIAASLHPDRIMDSIDDSNANNFILAPDSDFARHFPALHELAPVISDELGCIKRLLRSLDAIIVERGAPEEIVSSNRRRHLICQLETVFCDLLGRFHLSDDLNPQMLAVDTCMYTGNLIKYLQTNYARNCEDHSRADKDQQLAIKLFLDIAYSIVPQLQSALFVSDK